jgi:hypothetical protein
MAQNRPFWGGKGPLVVQYLRKYRRSIKITVGCEKEQNE